jgi:hypothetical protein
MRTVVQSARAGKRGYTKDTKGSTKYTKIGFGAQRAPGLFVTFVSSLCPLCYPFLLPLIEARK